MNMNTILGERAWIMPLMVPQNMKTAAHTSRIIDMGEYFQVSIVVITGKGTAGEDITVSMSQVDDQTNVKDLNVKTVFFAQSGDWNTRLGGYRRENNWDNEDITDTTSAEQDTIWVWSVNAADMDTENNYTKIRISVSQTTNDQLGCVLGVFEPARSSPVKGIV